MVKEIIQIGNPTLYQTSVKLAKEEITSSETQTLVKDLLDTLNSDPESSAGLSAVQIGVLKQVYIIRRVDLEEGENSTPIWLVIINPTLKKVSTEQSYMWEGCLSVGKDKNRLFAPVARAEEVALEYFDGKGRPQTLKADGYLAHIVMHEEDHLNGILFLKYITSPDNIWTGERLDKYIQQYGKYPPIKL